MKVPRTRASRLGHLDRRSLWNVSTSSDAKVLVYDESGIAHPGRGRHPSVSLLLSFLLRSRSSDVLGYRSPLKLTRGLIDEKRGTHRLDRKDQKGRSNLASSSAFHLVECKLDLPDGPLGPVDPVGPAPCQCGIFTVLSTITHPWGPLVLSCLCHVRIVISCTVVSYVPVGPVAPVAPVGPVLG